MIEPFVVAEPEWPFELDWQAIAVRAVAAAVRESSFAALAETDVVIEVAIRLTSDGEVHALNHGYRKKNQPTNVLSFPMLAPEEVAAIPESPVPEVLLGDIVLAHGVCTAEADERGVTLAAHASHLIVHGMLHLLGYDHIEDRGAEEMETAEKQAMKALGLHDPYAEAGSAD